jgi:DNA-binding PadR family transcriptional regulator
MVRRGDVRTAILALLVEEPMHGYQVIRLLNERSGGMWRVSAGSVYPTLQQLEDEGLVTSELREGRKVYVLTDDGKALAARSSTERAPWDMPGSSEAADLRDLFSQVGAAVWQVSHVGSAATVARAGAILTEARRSLYRLLAEDDRTDATSPTAATYDPSSEDGR